MNRLMRLLVALTAFAPLGAFAQISGGTGLSGGPLFINITGSTQCLHADTNGVISGTGSDCASGSSATGANPTGTVGLSAVNGSAATFLRSDGAPPLSQSITPTWTGLHKFTLADFALLGSSTGYTLLESGLSGAGNNTLTLPVTSSDTLAALGTVQTWTAAQTFTNSDLVLLGSSTGATTFASANAGASNFTLTFPAATDTLAALGTIQSWSAAQTFNALLTASAGATISGAAINLNNNSNFAVNAGTGTSTGTVTLGQNSATPGSVVLKGPVSFQAGTAYSAASWGLTSPVFNGAAMTLNDTTASGTVTNDVGYSLQAVNFTSTGGASTTITSAIGAYFAAPTCTTVICTSKYAIWSAGQLLSAGAITGQAGMGVTGASVSLNNNSNFGVNLGTGTSTGTVAIGNTAGTGSAITLAAPTTLGFGTSLSQATWGTAGIALIVPTATFNDTTTGSGTVADDAAYGIASPTFTNTQGTANTLTNATTLFVAPPLCTTGASNWSACTNKYAIKSTGAIFTTGLMQAQGGLTITGAAVSLNNNSNFAVNIGTGTSTGTVTLGQNSSSPGAVALNGPVSFNAGTATSSTNWGSVSPVWNIAAMTLNDSAASGTITTDSAITMQSPTFTSTGGASTTITNAVGLNILAPTCSGGVVCSNIFAIQTNGVANLKGGLQASGAAINLNVGNNFATNIGTSTTTTAVTIGGGSNGVVINSNQSGSIKNTGLMSTGTKFTLASGTGSCGTTGTLVGGATAGSFICTGTAGVGTITITMNGATGLTAPNGWACTGSDSTSGTAWVQHGAVSATTCILGGTTAANTDVITFIAVGY